MSRCVLYHNNGNGTFTDATETSGIRSIAVGDQRGVAGL